MKVFGHKIKEGYFTTDIKESKIEYKIEKILNGYKISGRISGKLDYIKILEINKPKEKLYINNWQSWGPFLEEEEYKNIKNVELNRKIGTYTYTPIPEIFKKNLISDYFILSDSLFSGFLTSKIAHPFFIIKNDTIEGYLKYFDTKFEDFIPLEPLVVLENLSKTKALIQYGDLVKLKNNIKIKHKVPIGWSTWYQYFLNLTWEDIIKNLRLSKEMDMPYEVFQIDDGYEKEIGDWFLTKKGFPEIPEVAKIIKSYGYTPGIWTAPLSIGERSIIYEKHKDWLVKEKGNPKKAYYNWEEDIYTLDITKNEAKNWVFSLFSDLKKAGYEYFKIDFMFAGAIPGERNKNLTPIQAYIEGLSIIRKAVGNSFILGCGAPFLSSVGFVDGMRIGPDTGPIWKKEKEPGDLDAYWALKISIMRWFMHKKWWINDPDCLLLRDKETQLSYSQREVYAIVSGILDNMIIQSDNLLYIKENERKLLEKAISLQGGRSKVKFTDNNDIFIISEEGGKSGNIKIAVNLDNKPASWKQREISPISYIVIEDDIEGTSLTKKIIKREDGRIFTYYEGNN